LAGHARIQFGNRRASLSSASRRDLATAMSGAIGQSRNATTIFFPPVTVVMFHANEPGAQGAFEAEQILKQYSQ
jgi:hypothetical protein